MASYKFKSLIEYKYFPAQNKRKSAVLSDQKGQRLTKAFKAKLKSCFIFI